MPATRYTDLFAQPGYAPIALDEIRDLDSIETTVLINALESQRKLIDVNLTRPAAWRGELRRKASSQRSVEDLGRVRATFNWLTEELTRQSLDTSFVQLIHDIAVGGKAFRSKTTKIAHFRDFPGAADVPSLLCQALSECDASTEAAPLTAAKLHLRVLDIHPFRDGNGRTARLLSSFILMRAGYRSTLLTATEQHFRLAPKCYARILAEYRNGSVGQAAVLNCFLLAMISNAYALSWLRMREKRLLRSCRQLESDKDRLTGEMGVTERADLIGQADRLRREERADSRNRSRPDETSALADIHRNVNTAPSLQSIQKNLRDQRIALIGNAKSVLTRPKDIDSYDKVIRLNRGYPRDREAFLGTRTDVLGLAIHLGSEEIVEEFDPALLIWVSMAAWKKGQEHVPKWQLSPLLAASAYQTGIPAWNDCRNKLGYRPSTGCLMIHFLASNISFKSLTLFGFDWWETPTWYYESGPGPHCPMAEKRYVKQLQKTHNIIIKR